jgi:hypothetical protein
MSLVLTVAAVGVQDSPTHGVSQYSLLCQGHKHLEVTAGGTRMMLLVLEEGVLLKGVEMQVAQHPETVETG